MTKTFTCDFYVRAQLVPGCRGGGGGGVKVNLFQKKGSWAGTFMFPRKSSQRNIQISIAINYEVLQYFIAWASGKTKIPNCSIFLIPTMVKAELELMYLWFLQSEQKSIRIVNSTESN